MPESKNVHSLEIHDTLEINTAGRRYSIMRVPGGWIYTYFGKEGISSVFVPMNSEGKGKKDFFVI